LTDEAAEIVRLTGERVVVRSIAGADVDDLKRIHDEPAVARWWETMDAEDDDWPFEVDYGEVKFTIEVDGRVAGLIQYIEETEPKYKSAAMDIFVATEFHGQAIGSDAVRTLARYLIEERGHHRLEIDPNVDNIAAIKAYSKVGFKRVGVTRKSERDAISGEWTDGLLMDLLADELTAPDDS
jgi:aminoglycoside 6'-N-acetyltransferase